MLAKGCLDGASDVPFGDRLRDGRKVAPASREERVCQWVLSALRSARRVWVSTAAAVFERSDELVEVGGGRDGGGGSGSRTQALDAAGH